jgi:hypothetical protein
VVVLRGVKQEAVEFIPAGSDRVQSRHKQVRQPRVTGLQAATLAQHIHEPDQYSIPGCIILPKRTLQKIVIALFVIIAQRFFVDADTACFGRVTGFDTDHKLQLISFENLGYPNLTCCVSGLMTSSTR